MQKTAIVIAFFLAALLAGLFAISQQVPAKPKDDNTSGKETFMQREKGMPLDTQPVAGYTGTSPILGSEPKPVSEKPYDMANDQELFQFENNRISADCCPSAFSTDRGCVCLTDAQLKDFANRGGNRA
jgi:hypothetical protein